MKLTDDGLLVSQAICNDKSKSLRSSYRQVDIHTPKSGNDMKKDSVPQSFRYGMCRVDWHVL